MNDKWQNLSTNSRIQMVRDIDAALLKTTYALNDEELENAKKVFSKLAQVRARGKLRRVSAAPDKRSLREASRDFTLTLVFAELIDNSIDRFIRNAPSNTDTLNITIGFDRITNSCIYEDDAGGFEPEQVPNFFQPGGTNNQVSTFSIGSYAWGAKKARSALAESVDLLSRPQNGGKACLASIDEGWDDRDEDWFINVGEEGKHFDLPTAAKLLSGHTRLVFKNVKESHAINDSAFGDLRRDLGELYALLIARHGRCPYPFNINIQVQQQVVTADFQYKWTQYHDESIDLRPRSYRCVEEVLLPFGVDDTDKKQKVEVILEIGVKQDTQCATGSIEHSNFFDPADDWGIDVYGLGMRLIERNVRAPLGLTQDLVQNQQAAKLVKGRLIIIGSSYAIPWDTHKMRIALGHPTLGMINETLGQFIQEYVRCARKTARGGLQNAVRHFRDNPWDGKWTSTDRGGNKIPLSYDLTKAGIPQEIAALMLPRTRPSRANGSARQKRICFPVTERELQAISRWLKCDPKEVGESLKRRVLSYTRGLAPQRSRSGRANLRSFERLRQRINNPEILAFLQAGGLNTVTDVKKAGTVKLKVLGLTDSQITTVGEALRD
jgi:hypothetical protein